MAKTVLQEFTLGSLIAISVSAPYKCHKDSKISVIKEKAGEIFTLRIDLFIAGIGPGELERKSRKCRSCRELLYLGDAVYISAG